MSVKELMESVNSEFENFAALDEADRILSEQSIVKMDTATKRRRMLTQAVLIAAKEANDPLYIKYQKASKRRRMLRAEIQKKYQAAGAKKLRDWNTRSARA